MAGTVRGDRIRKLRDQRDLSQGQLATYAGIAQSWLSEVERSEPSNVGSDALVAIAKVLETSIDYLCGLTDDPRSPTRRPLEALTAEEETMIRQYRAIKDERARSLLRDFVASAVENKL